MFPNRNSHVQGFKRFKYVITFCKALKKTFKFEIALGIWFLLQLRRIFHAMEWSYYELQNVKQLGIYLKEMIYIKIFW